jgi:SnoaL-like domain
MTQNKVQTYERYLAAWSAVPDEERERLLRGSVAEDVLFSNPQQVRHGIGEVVEHLEAFQKRSPGGSFQMNNMIGWADHGLAEWQLFDGEGKAGFSGYDVVAFDQRGFITSILLFANVEAQKLAWRRRDAVSLGPTV